MVNTRDETGATGEDSGILPPHISSSCQESSGLHGPSVEMPFQNTQLGGGLSTRNRMNNRSSGAARDAHRVRGARAVHSRCCEFVGGAQQRPLWAPVVRSVSRRRVVIT